MSARVMSMIRPIFSAAVMLGVTLLISGCEQEKVSQIEWQLPLEKPEDLHAGQNHDAVPEWAVLRNGHAEFIWLEKATTRRHSTTVALGGAAELNGWDIRLLGLASGLRVQNRAFLNDENVHNPAAFVEVSRDGKGYYRGWLYQKFPELFGMDNPGWKVWLKDITFRPPSETEGKAGSLSSAG
ncbi:DUF2155 domain-containing protein [Mariprofundus sp. KV]|uniref:DUF2155 domain-containing protein n=1 Tax=Mariprofundus sp. KV TaxID=2608715 RepID=UPI001F50631C|nr:DUF2155 domain-containing protein [Mariprofundus sp. KV]